MEQNPTFNSKSFETPCSNNRVFVCHVIEYETEELIEYKHCDHDDWNEINSDSDVDDVFKPIIVSDDDEVKSVNDCYIEKKSTFQCEIKYQFEMCHINASIQSVEDIMTEIIPKTKWTKEDHKLLTRFDEYNIYNKYDLYDGPLINKLRTTLIKEKDDVIVNKIYQKFSAFTQKFNEDLEKNNNLHRSLKQYVIQSVEVTRNAKCLQQYIQQYKKQKNIMIENTTTNATTNDMMENKYDPEMEDGEGETKHDINIDIDNTLIVAYNPLQTVVVRSNIFQDVTHAIHLYRGAYDEKFYPKYMLNVLFSEWMLTFNASNYVKLEDDDIERYMTVINALSTLLRFNRKYDIILVPSSINLDEEFLNGECQVIAPHHEAISEWRISCIFLYKGNLYRFDEIKHQQRYGDNKIDDDQEKIFMDEVKVVLRHLHDNIKYDDIDALDPNMEAFKHNDMKEDVNKLLDDESAHRLRGCIKRTSCDKIFKWLNIGCGVCYLQESNGRITEIGSPQNRDYEMKFPSELQKSMFFNCIDCKIPYNTNMITEDKKCAICRDLQIKPTSIGDKECNHTFCKRCIEQWKEMRNAKIDEYKYNADVDDDDESENNNKNCAKCPLCQRKIIELCVDKYKENEMKENIPATIYQQISDDNINRYIGIHAIDNYYHQRQQEQIWDAIQTNEPLREIYQNNPERAIQDAGY